MQGYLLADAKGNRINVGPTDIVRDRQEIIGTPEIVNGLSCMACHKQGMIREYFSDDVRLGVPGILDSLAIGSDACIWMQCMKPLLEQDESRFLVAFQRSARPVS